MLVYKQKFQLDKNKYILRLVILGIYLISMLSFWGSKYEGYYKVIEIMNIVFIGSIIIMTNNKYSKNNNSLSIILGIGLINNIVLYIFKFLTFEKFSLRAIESLMLEHTGIIIGIVEYLVIMLAIKGSIEKNYIKRVRKKFILLGLFALTSITVLSYIDYFGGDVKTFYYRNGLNYIVTISLYIITYICVIASKIPMTINQRKTLLIFINMIFLSDFISGFSPKFFSHEDLSNAMVISYAMDYFAYYILYEGFISNSLEKYYENLYERIISSEKSIKQRNTILKNRSALLKELNLLVEKGRNHHNDFINSINDFICIFKDNKLSYINKSALDFIGDSFDNVLLEEKITEFHEQIINKNSNLNKNIESRFELSLRDRFDQDIDLEIYYLTLSNSYTFMLVKNITEEKRIREKQEYLKKYYEEEYLKREFFSNISHELRTPINVISSALQLKEIHILEKNIKAIENDNINIRHSSLRLIRTINNFIDVNRISEKFLSGEFAFYNIVELVESVLHCSKKYFDGKNMDFIFDTEEEEVFIKIDKNFTERVILNILSNCVKYGDNGGNVYINIKLEKEDIIISIENDGKLISKEEKNYIFDKFTKNNKAFNRSSEGSGLGLYISKSLMELQNGSLGIGKNENEKNVFLITFKKEKYKECDIIADYENYSDIYISDLMEKVDIEFSDIYLY